MDEGIKIIVKWSGKEYEISDLTLNDSVVELKLAIQTLTGVRPHRQKLLNVKFKGKPAEDGCKLSSLGLKPGFKIMMMGSLEEDIQSVDGPPEDLPDVVNDLDIKEESVALENCQEHLEKIQRRVATYTITERVPPREGKKLLVLDIDYTLFDHRSAAETGAELMRPYLHEFLTTVYEHYEIVIWSATSMKWIEEKMNLLGVSTHADYKVWFYIDGRAMISVFTQKLGVVSVKPLAVIWGKFPQYSAKNTIMFDDLRRNFLMNPRNGLRIRAFRQAHLNRSRDIELLRLRDYLLQIKDCDDLSELDHSEWESYGRGR